MAQEIGFELIRLVRTHSAHPRDIGMPDVMMIAKLRAARRKGAVIILVSDRVDDEARTVRELSNYIPNIILENWYDRMRADMIARMIIATWCLEHVGFSIPVANMRQSAAWRLNA